MVQITLTNHHTEPKYNQVVIDVLTGKCVCDNQHNIELKDLLEETNFCHPLLNEPFSYSSTHFYQYEYDDVAGLLYCGRFVYAVLLRVDKPLECHFKINPASTYQSLCSTKKVRFSIDYNKPAKDVISINTLEKMVVLLTGDPFHFSEDLLVDDEFATLDLPEVVDGDLLYKNNPELISILKSPADTRRFELRYINPIMRLGLFSNENIRQGELISIYSGVKKIHADVYSQYKFLPKDDSLGTRIDAHLSGNLTRFINHSSQSDLNQIESAPSPWLEDNIKQVSEFSNGFQVVVFYAARDISKGEQLLLNYGSKYNFEMGEAFKFKKDGQLDVPFKVAQEFSQLKLNQLYAMGKLGVGAARKYTLQRLAIRVIASLLLIETVLFLLQR